MTLSELFVGAVSAVGGGLATVFGNALRRRIASRWLSSTRLERACRDYISAVDNEDTLRRAREGGSYRVAAPPADGTVGKAANDLRTAVLEWQHARR